MTSLHFQFGNTDLKTFIAHPYKPEETGWDTLGFEPFPTTSDVLVLTGEPYTNNHDNNRVKISYEKARNWGNRFQSMSAIYFDAYTSSGQERRKYAVKVAFNSEMVTTEITPCFKGLKRLTADAKFYGEHLQESDLAPKHYGLWRAETDGWGGDMLFTVMDWGGYSWDQLKNTEHDIRENRIIIGRTVEILHDDNLRHGNLNSDHHILFEPKSRQCLLVDFSRAREHICHRNLPILPTDAGYVENVECYETFNLIYKFCFMDAEMHPTPSTNTWKAIHFLQRYCSRFPRLHHADARMVQRRHFFDDSPLFAAEFGFGEDGELVDIHENSKSEVMLDELVLHLSGGYLLSDLGSHSAQWHSLQDLILSVARQFRLVLQTLEIARDEIRPLFVSVSDLQVYPSFERLRASGRIMLALDG